MEASENCPVKCRVIDGSLTHDYTDIDAIIVSYHNLPKDWENWVKQRQTKHGVKIVLLGLEPPSKAPALVERRFLEKFDWFSYYELNSDIPFPYRDFQERLNPFFQPGNWNFKNSLNISLMASFVSLCDEGGRVEYLQEMEKVMKIDHHGPCLRNQPPVPKGDHENPLVSPGEALYANKLEVLKKYKFTFAFENSEHKDYVTEKLYHPFMVGSIPVYKGAPNVRDFLPGPHSAILANEFSGPKELAEFLVRVGKDQRLYNEYFEYQRFGISAQRLRVEKFTRYSLPCYVCMKLANYTEPY